MNDRGTKKWTAMMMPEQIQMLNKMWAEQDYKEKPILDEQQIIDINTALQMAIYNDLTVEIKYYSCRDYLTKKGKLLKIDTSKIRLDDYTEIKLDNVLDVYID